MQQLRLCLWGILFGSSILSVSAQQIQRVIKITPLKLITRGLDVSAEYAFADEASAELGVQYTLPWDIINFADFFGINLTTDQFAVTGADLSGWKVTPGVRYYFAQEAPKGMYGSVFVRFMNYKLSTAGNINTSAGPFGGNVNYRLQGLGPGISLGYQFVFDNGVVIDYHLGGGINVNGIRVSGQFSGAGADALQEILDEVDTQLDQVLGPIPFVNPPDLEVVEDEFSVRLARVVYPVFRVGLSVGFGI